MVRVCCARDNKRLVLDWTPSSVTSLLCFCDRAAHWTKFTRPARLLVWQATAILLSASQLPGLPICRSPCLYGKFFTNWAIFPAVPLDSHMIIYWLAYQFSTVKSSVCCQKYSLDYNFKYQFCECFVSLLFKDARIKPFFFVPSSTHIHLLLSSSLWHF